MIWAFIADVQSIPSSSGTNILLHRTDCVSRIRVTDFLSQAMSLLPLQGFAFSSPLLDLATCENIKCLVKNLAWPDVRIYGFLSFTQADDMPNFGRPSRG
jgi:hypothetical protein